MQFFDGDRVRWVGGGGIQAEGSIIAVGTTAAHVKWDAEPGQPTTTMVDLFDIEPVTAKAESDPFHVTAVRRAYDEEQEAGVLNFLASNDYLGTWEKIASDILNYAQQRIRHDASMDLVDEQLSILEKQRVVKAAALVLLRDAFSEEE